MVDSVFVLRNECVVCVCNMSMMVGTGSPRLVYMNGPKSIMSECREFVNWRPALELRRRD